MTHFQNPYSMPVTCDTIKQWYQCKEQDGGGGTLLPLKTSLKKIELKQSKNKKKKETKVCSLLFSCILRTKPSDAKDRGALIFGQKAALPEGLSTRSGSERINLEWCWFANSQSTSKIGGADFRKSSPLHRDYPCYTVQWLKLIF